MTEEFINYVNKYFIKNYKINFYDCNDIIIIDNILFPNYFKNKYLNINSKEQEYETFEFCRIMYKIFGGNYLNTNLSYYENRLAFIKQNDIVFDCGSNLGIFACYAAAKGAIVYCFEPCSLIRHYLKQTRLLYPNNIRIIPYGVSNITNIAIINQYDNPAASRIVNLQQNNKHKILYQEQVNLISIDNFIKQKNIIPTFIKMDIEGNEIEALIGAQNTLKKYQPIISIAFHPGYIQEIENIKNKYNQIYQFQTFKRQHFDPLLIGVPNNE